MRAFALMLLAACGSAPDMVEGKIVDIWGQPIEGATVMVVGLDERPLTDREGKYTLRRRDGKHLLKAGKEGYVQEHAEFTIEGEKPQAPVLRLYPKPEENGFFVVRPQQYTRLPPTAVVMQGNELSNRRGLKALGEASAEGPDVQILFHTELRLDEINRLGLELHKLAYVRDTELKGPTGTTNVRLNMYVTEKELEFELSPLRSRTDYLVLPKAALEAGHYALQTQDLLDSMELSAFNQMSAEHRVVFPFEVR
jgi:hypothetical protein